MDRQSDPVSIETLDHPRDEIEKLRRTLGPWRRLVVATVEDGGSPGASKYMTAEAAEDLYGLLQEVEKRLDRIQEWHDSPEVEDAA